MASARADLKVAERFTAGAVSAADSTLATVNDIRAQGIKGPELDQAIQAADKAQKAADTAKKDIEKARQSLDAQAKSKAAIPGTMASLNKAMDSSFAANENGQAAIGVLAKAPEKVAPARIVDAHMKDVLQKQDQVVKAMTASDAALKNLKKVEAASGSKTAANAKTVADVKKPAADAKSVADVKPAGAASKETIAGAASKTPSGKGASS